MNQGITFKSKVLVALNRLLPNGEGNLDGVVAELQISKRTEQRHLKQENLSFANALEQHSKERVQNHLNMTEHSILEISLLLGYSDSNSLNVAFRNWFACCPKEFKQRR